MENKKKKVILLDSKKKNNPKSPKTKNKKVKLIVKRNRQGQPILWY